MIRHRHRFFGGLACAHTVGENDVAEHGFGGCRELFGRGHWEGQHIGRLVLAAIIAVEGLDRIVAVEADGDFDAGGDGDQRGMRGVADGDLGGLGQASVPILASRPALVDDGKVKNVG
jgi:hypothetical protein